VKFTKLNYQTHLYFLSLIAVHYLISIFFIGEIIIEPHDNLDIVVVYDHVISKIYKGNIESLNYFLSGEIRWYYLEKLFYPLNILHYLLDDKFFYFTNDILKKIIPYFSFFLLAKSLGASRFNSALGGVLYSTILYIQMPLGLALHFLPYILYLLLTKNSLSKKHYLFLFLIGLNSSLVQDIFTFIFLFPLAFLLSNKKNKFNIYLKIFTVIFISSLLSNIHLVIGSVLSEPIHREIMASTKSSIIFSLQEAFKIFFTYVDTKNPLFIFHIPLTLLTGFILILSFFSKHKNIRKILFFIIFILILKSIMGYSLVDNIFVGTLEILKGYNFQRVDRIIPIGFSLLFVLIISDIKSKNLKNLLIIFSFFSILSVQLKTPTTEIGRIFLSNNMNVEKFNEIKVSISKNNYIRVFKNIFNNNNYEEKEINLNHSTIRTFDNYYNFKDYLFIKNIVKESRIMSVGLDPMVAVMNDIKVIDGYHTIYPLSYKIKFRKIIEQELKNNINLKKYYDDWGNRVYAFYTDKNNILLDFQFAKTVGAEYILSRFPIDNNDLKIICFQCNNSNYIFLYKIL